MFGHLIRQTSPRGNASRTIDASGNLSGQADSHYSTVYGYYGTGVTAAPPAFCNLGSTAVDQSGQLATTSVYGIATATNVYDAAGRKIATTDGAGTTCTTYTAEGRVASTKDGDGHVTSSTYDPVGNTLSVTTADNAVSSTKYDEANRVLSKTDPDSHTTSYLHDAAGDVTQTTEPTTATTSSTYDLLGEKTTNTDELHGAPTQYFYNQLGKQTQVETPLQHSSYTSYDALGRVSTTTDGRGKVTRYYYDGDGNQTSVVQPLSDTTTATTTSHYDDAGRLDWKQDANQHTTYYGYDLDGNQTTVTAPDQGVTTYVSNPAGKTTSITDPDQHTTNYKWDAAGRLYQKIDPLQRTTTHYYDPAGNETKVVAADGTTTKKSYDVVNRLSGIDYSDSTPDVSFSYDNAGNRLTMVDGAGTETYGYDAMNRLTSAVRGSSGFAYTYDAAGHVLSRTYPDGTATTYTYDNDGNMATVTSGGATTSYSYDAAKNLTATVFPNGWTESRSYDDAGRVADIHSTNGIQTIGAAAYTRDAVGNPTQIVRDGVTENYSYDANDRVTAVCYGASIGSCGTSQLITYSYDEADNRLSQTRFGTSTTYNHDAAGALTQSVSGGTTTYVYDQRGNQTQAGSTHYTWDATNHMLAATNGGTTLAAFSYDGLGNRLTKAVSGLTTSYAWDENAALPQLATEQQGGSTLRAYIVGAGLTAVKTAGSLFYFHEDDLGSVVGLTSTAGALEVTYEYDPYGVSRGETDVDPSAPANSIQYTTQLLDDETGLYDLRAREYSPSIGGFLSIDPVQQGGSAVLVANYAYTSDRPETLVDPSGLLGVGRARVPLGAGDWEIKPDRSSASLEVSDKWKTRLPFDSYTEAWSWVNVDTGDSDNGTDIRNIYLKKCFIVCWEAAPEDFKFSWDMKMHTGYGTITLIWTTTALGYVINGRTLEAYVGISSCNISVAYFKNLPIKKVAGQCA